MDYFKKSKISNILQGKIDSYEDVIVLGWVKTKRVSKNIAFLEVNDGSTVKNLQIVVLEPSNFELEDINRGSSVRIKGYLEDVPNREQSIEMKAEEIDIIGTAPENYVLQKKEHTFEFLREIAHLRPRTKTFSTVNRFRNKMAYGIHKYYQERGFQYIHAPIITASDAEGAGEMFKVTTLDLDNITKDDKNKVNFTEDFFGEQTGLTVSGQLEAEVMATALGDVYTFGPTFRAENSNTSRHASEFWMMEPEMAFCNLEEMMDIIEDFIKNLFEYALNEAAEEMEFFAENIEEGRKETLKNIINSTFARITYTEAIDILKEADQDFEFPVEWGMDLQTEHERYLTEQHYQKPVLVTDYPKEIKAFYMRLNDDQKTVAAVDCLVPEVGEIIGGSQREERYDVLKERMEEENMNIDKYDWFLELRKFGTVPHSGFGLGFERILMYISGIKNIRDVIPFPRTPGNAKF
ncbi:MAG TPA: asparagine--tRNA ligase [Halanaerobiales bacterium]|nr:asparagine--tRNA ligase [Halanaerobiales bacterium]